MHNLATGPHELTFAQYSKWEGEYLKGTSNLEH